MLKSWPRQQKTISLSSAEAELHAAVAASSKALMSLLRDMGVESQGEIKVVSSAALGIVQRAGCGRVWHLHLQAL